MDTDLLCPIFSVSFPSLCFSVPSLGLCPTSLSPFPPFSGPAFPTPFSGRLSFPLSLRPLSLVLLPSSHCPPFSESFPFGLSVSPLSVSLPRVFVFLTLGPRALLPGALSLCTAVFPSLPSLDLYLYVSDSLLGGSSPNAQGPRVQFPVSHKRGVPALAADLPHPVPWVFPPLAPCQD